MQGVEELREAGQGYFIRISRQRRGITAMHLFTTADTTIPLRFPSDAK